MQNFVNAFPLACFAPFVHVGGRGEALLDQIEQLALDADAVVSREDQFGLHLRVNLTIIGVTNQTALIRTGWRVAPGNNTAELTTLFVL